MVRLKRHREHLAELTPENVWPATDVASLTMQLPWGPPGEPIGIYARFVIRCIQLRHSAP